MIFTAWGRLVNLYETRIMRLLSHFWAIRGPAFEKAARKVAEAMVQESAAANASSWRSAAMRSSNSRRVYQGLRDEIRTGNLAPVLRAIAHQNAQLITSLPGSIARQMSQRAAQMVLEGKRPAEIEKEIAALRPHLIRSRVKLIARTEVSKAETDLTRARAQRLGIDWYVWQTSEDQRVRDSHRHMDQVLVAWDDAPAPEVLIKEKNMGHYHPGQIYNCRCVALPLADLSEVHWPAKVYRSGSITKMTRAQFAKVARIPMAA
jgi:SPP1 gp7 family putative phage head morphogenesis protein